MAPPRLRGLAGRLALLLGSLAVALLAAELLVRALGVAPEVFAVQRGRFRLSANPRLGYEPVPHFAAPDDGPMHDWAGRANALGLRDREHDAARPAGARRIVVLGDSIVQGYFVADDRRLLTTVLERELRAAGVAAEVLNFGVNGYNTRQEVALLADRGLAFAPDLVVVAVCINDAYLDSGGIEADLRRELAGRGRGPALPPWLARSALARLAFGVLDRTAAPPAEVGEAPAALVEEGLIEGALRELAQLARAHDFAVLIAFFPQLDVFDPAARVDPFADVAAAARALGFATLDLFPALAACHAESSVVGDLIHPNAWGHACSGAAIARHVAATGLGGP